MKNFEKLNKMQGIFWSRTVKKIDPEKDKTYIIHQVLMYGGLNDIEMLKKTYSLAEIKNTFIKYPSKIYTPQAFNFISKFILDIKNSNAKKYVKSTSRNIR